MPGQPQPSFDKQYLRDWLISSGLRNKEGVTLPEDVVLETKAKYEEAKDRVMGLGKFGVQGKRGVVAEAGNAEGLQTDQVADATSGAASANDKLMARGDYEIKGKKGLVAEVGNAAGTQTDQVADATAGLAKASLQ